VRTHSCLIALITAAGITFGCKSPRPASPQGSSTYSSGLAVAELALGEGPSPRLGQTCVVEARGWIEEKGGKGKLFLDTRKRGYPDTFPLGVGRVIKGWDEGVATMKKGGRRWLRVPPALGYSPVERGQDIPTDAALIFELELVDIR
jgi:peptidylprolyl isomerase